MSIKLLIGDRVNSRLEVFQESVYARSEIHRSLHIRLYHKDNLGDTSRNNDLTSDDISKLFICAQSLEERCFNNLRE